MTAKFRISHKIVSIVLTIALLISCLPTILTAVTANEEEYILASDSSTIDGWKQYFPVSGNISTMNAGGIWSDKSVFKSNTNIDGQNFTINGKNSFLVALSAIGSNMSVTGKAAVPTDTVMVLDTSGSMSGSPAVGMIEAVNVSINQLMDANPKNRVAIVFFAGNVTTFLPLDHYETTDSNGKFLDINTWGTSISLNSNVRDGDGNRVTIWSNSRSVSGGTYTALGLESAMSILTASSNRLDQANSPKIPVVMLFTDGIPTYAANNFTDPPSNSSSSGIGNGQSNSAGVAEVFATELTAAYVKAQITAKYGAEYGCLFYTLGQKGTETNSLREAILDPVNKNTNALDDAWEDYNDLRTGSSVRVDGESFTKVSTELSMDYVDGYFDVDSYQSGTTTLEEALSKAFSDVVSEIVSKSVYSPTLLEGADHNLSGYVSFVDKIGSYMKVTDVKGIMSGGKLFSGEALAHALADAFDNGQLDESSALVIEGLQSGITRLGVDKATAQKLLQNAYDHGQISYDPATGTFSNWVGWISDAQGAYLDAWYEGMTLPVNAAHINASYIFLGADSNTDMMYTTVRVRERVSSGVPTGEQDVAFAVPASLLPKITYKVDLDENKNVTNIEVVPETPIHFIYEVGLDPEINSFNIRDKVSAEYLSKNTDPATGEVYFYTNEWERAPGEDGRLTGYGKINTYSYFKPSRQNDRFYYQNDSLIYTDTNGTVYNGSNPANSSRTLYYYYYYYAKSGNSFETVYEYHAIPRAVLGVAHSNGDGTWTIKQGTVRSDFAGEDAEVVRKADNASNTLIFSHEPFNDTNSYSFDDETHSFIAGATLANNGRIAVMPETGVKITKALAPDVELEDGEDPTFTFDVVYAGQNGDLEAYAYRFVNGELVGDMETVSFEDGKAAVSLKAGETLYIGGMETGNVTVTERTSLKYVLHSVAVGGTPFVGTSASVNLAAGDMKEINFVNTVRNTGAFTVAKEIIHGYGAGYSVPVNENTAFSVELTFTFDGKPLSGEYVVAHTGGNESGIKLNGTDGEKVTITLRHDDQYTVYGLPEGTVVKAVEKLTTAQANSFTATYENGVNEVVIAPNATVQVIINNEYEAQSVSPTVTVTGKKTLTGNAYSGSFTFSLQEYVGGAYILDSSWNTLESETVTYENSLNGKTFAFDYTFGEFDTVGTYIYRVKEANPAVEGMIYDARLHSFQINVTDTDMDGKLEASVSTNRAPQITVTGSGNNWAVNADFVNEYTNDHVVSISIDVQKEITNLSASPIGNNLAGFEFGLYDENGALIEKLTTNSAGAVLFTNTYKASDIGTHVYTLKEIKPATIPAGWTYTDKEVEITVTVSQVQGENHLQAVIETDDATAVVNGTEAVVTFTNTYNLKDASLTIDFVSKQMTSNIGDYLLKDGEFSFAIYEVINGVRGTTPVATGTNDANGAVTFDKALTYNKVGGPYLYEIVELTPDNAPSYITYDATVYKMLVTVTDNNGQLVATPVVESVANNNVVFHNVYTAEPTEVTIEGTKTLTGRPLLENDFQFILSQNASSNVWYSANGATSTDTASFKFPTLTFIRPGTYTYKVSEFDPASRVAGYFDGVKYDDTVYTVVVTVADNGEGKLVATYTVDGSADKAIAFNNIYAPDSLDIKVIGTKALLGRDLLESDEFTFDMYGADYDADTRVWTKGSLIGTAQNEEDGAIVFEAVTVEKAGSYYFIVTERETDAKGITFDETEWRVIVNVADNQHGILSVSSMIFINEDGRQNGMVFTNTYTTTEGALNLAGIKNLTGRDLVAGEFSFTLYNSGEDGAEGDAIQTVTNGADGVFTFDGIVYEEAGTYVYYVKEDAGNLTGVTYDGTVYRIVVEVTDDLEGKLVVEYTVYDETETEQTSIVFENVYTNGSPDTADGIMTYLVPIAVSGAVITLIARRKKKEDEE